MNSVFPVVEVPTAVETAVGTPIPAHNHTTAVIRLADEPSKPKATIQELRATLARWLCIPPEDADLIDFCLAVYKSHEIPGDPLWGIFIDASGAGKTELLRAFRSRPDTYFLSSLTEKTLVSGYRDPKKPDKDPSLLPALNEKVLIIKDLSPLLAMRRESRNAVISQLRDAYVALTINVYIKSVKESQVSAMDVLEAKFSETSNNLPTSSQRLVN